MLLSSMSPPEVFVNGNGSRNATLAEQLIIFSRSPVIAKKSVEDYSANRDTIANDCENSFYGDLIVFCWCDYVPFLQFPVHQAKLERRNQGI
ncbi:hypothetical protein ANCCEY_12411 [Ancylostoma ceylanicum]|uniref:Uncharacterized protein n=1 Tax=Ancylostoma ceylanicum TaxID=53326 RepID=A0A0D6LB98_9BILA|nr:hypothetical protein ANCCEY_12411 [Ancylostoma ceylanicum]